MQKIRQLLSRADSQLADLLGINRAAKFLHENGSLLVLLLLASVIAYGYDLFSFALKIDSENHAFFFGPQRAWVDQYRWAMFLLNDLFVPDSVMPFIPTLLAILGLAFSALFFVHTLSDKRNPADFVAGAVALACPVIYFAMYFTTLGYGLGIALALAALGVYLFDKPGYGAKFFAFCSFTFAIGIYQAVVPLLLTLFCLQAVAKIFFGKITSLRQLARHGFVFILILVPAYVANGLLGRALIAALDMRFDNAYLSQFFQYSPTASYFIPALTTTLHTTWNYYTGSKEYYLYDLPSLKILFLLSAAITLYRLVTTPQSAALRISGLCLLLIALFAPMAMHVLNGGYMPPRTVLGISFVIAAFSYFGMTISSNFLRLTIVMLAFYAFCNFSMINNRYAFSNQMTWLADRELSVQIQQRIYAQQDKLSPRPDPSAHYPLEIVGWHEYPESPVFIHREVIGSSFYTWGAGDPERITRFFATMGIFTFRPATREQKLSVLEAGHHMPIWPADGSVQIINNIAVVKLSEYNPHQIEAICAPPYNTADACQRYALK